MQVEWGDWHHHHPMKLIWISILGDRRYLTRGDVMDVRYMGQLRRLRVEKIYPDSPMALMSTNTQVIALLPDDKMDEQQQQEAAKPISYQDIGGLEEQIKQVREMVEISLQDPELFVKYGRSCVDVSYSC